jgi:hypothetical protein
VPILAAAPIEAQAFNLSGVDEAAQAMEHLLHREPDDELDKSFGGEGRDGLGEERRRHCGGAGRDRLRQEERRGSLGIADPGERRERVAGGGKVGAGGGGRGEADHRRERQLGNGRVGAARQEAGFAGQRRVAHDRGVDQAAERLGAQAEPACRGLQVVAQDRGDGPHCPRARDLGEQREVVPGVGREPGPHGRPVRRDAAGPGALEPDRGGHEARCPLLLQLLCSSWGAGSQDMTASPSCNC